MTSAVYFFCVSLQVAVSAGQCFTQDDQPLPAPPAGAHSFYTEQFAAALLRCRSGRNDSACQLLGNLCVLAQYDQADPACEQLLASLYFPVGGADELLAATDLTTKLFTRPPPEVRQGKGEGELFQ